MSSSVCTCYPSGPDLAGGRPEKWGTRLEAHKAPRIEMRRDEEWQGILLPAD